MREKIALGFLVAGVIITIAGTTLAVEWLEEGHDLDSTEMIETNETEHQEVDFSDTTEGLEDNASLYAANNKTSVVTMYLTATKGNTSENTDHTWSEINSYSIYDYENMGIERYGVNGLLQVGDEIGPVKGALGYEMYTPNATVSIRGQSSSENAQKNYKISLKEDENISWDGQQVINLNKHQGEGLRFRNKLMYDLLQEIPGLLSMKTQFVHLYVKDETESETAGFVDYGLYTQVEQPNKSFLERHGLDKNGQLYKLNMFEFYTYDETIRLKSDANYDESAFEALLEIKGSDDHSKLIAMLKDVNDISIPIEEVVEKWFDKENICSFLAFNILTGNIDTQSRNALLYSALNENTWYFISWDCDGAFENTEEELLGTGTKSGWEQGVSNYWGNVLFKRILQSSELRADLDEEIQEMRQIMTQEKLTAMVEQYKNVVEPYAYGEVDRMYEPLTQEEYEQVCEALPGEVEENYQFYKESIQEPMPFFLGTPEIEENQIEFEWDTSYDFQADTLYYTFELADNPDMEQPIIMQDGLFTAGYNYEGILSPGQYFYRVKVTDSDKNSQYAFDYYTVDNVKKYGVLCFYVLSDGTISLEGET